MKRPSLSVPRFIQPRFSKMLILILALACAYPVFGQTARQETDNRFDITRQRYDAASWPAGEARRGLPLEALTFPGYTGEAFDFAPHAPVIRRFADSSGTVRFLVEIRILETAAEAHQALVHYLTFVSSPNRVPSTAKSGITAGDIGYVGFAPADRISWIAFARGNTAVRISCPDPRVTPHPDMPVIARTIDKLILSQSLLNGNLAADRPTISGLYPSTRTCSAGDVLPVRLEAFDPSGEPASIRWVVGGSGQGYMEMDGAGAWNLHTTKAGSIDLTCLVLGARGSIVSETVSITVGEEE